MSSYWTPALLALDLGFGNVERRRGEGQWNRSETFQRDLLEDVPERPVRFGRLRRSVSISNVVEVRLAAAELGPRHKN